MSNSPEIFAEYMIKAMLEDSWSGPHPKTGDRDWAEPVIAYIDWLREIRRKVIGEDE